MGTVFLKKVLNVVNYTSVKEKKKLLKNSLQQSKVVNQERERDPEKISHSTGEW